MSATTNGNDPLRQRRARRNALWLGLLALGFYAAFIVLSMSRPHG
jgi:hypothetical protein